MKKWKNLSNKFSIITKVPKNISYKQEIFFYVVGNIVLCEFTHREDDIRSHEKDTTLQLAKRH